VAMPPQKNLPMNLTHCMEVLDGTMEAREDREDSKIKGNNRSLPLNLNLRLNLHHNKTLRLRHSRNRNRNPHR